MMLITGSSSSSCSLTHTRLSCLAHRAESICVSIDSTRPCITNSTPCATTRAVCLMQSTSLLITTTTYDAASCSSLLCKTLLVTATSGATTKHAAVHTQQYAKL
eukprot:711-Heterococcus_DN1.PRE.3